ncbi:MAG TPA: TRAP transporter substrate-binding protein [Burkholderiaceae bacterium]
MSRNILLAVVLLVATASAAWAGAPVLLKFNHIVASDTPKGQAALQFKALAEKYTGGRVKVEVYPNSQLYSDGEELQALQSGAVQMLAPSLAKLGALGMKEFEVFDLPYMFPNMQALYAVTEGPVGKAMLQKLEAKGIVGLGFWDNGFKLMSANRPLRLPADFKGLKMRVQASRVLEAQMRALGAEPELLAFSEIYRALRSGAIDGAENAPSNLYTQKFYEVQPHVTVSSHGYLGYAVLVNKKFWDGLAPDLRAQLERAMQDATRFEKAIAQRDNELALQAVRVSGKTTVHTLTPAEHAAWRAALLPLQTSMQERIGKQLVQDVMRATAAYR